jgi:hypothetical protein
MLSFDLEGISNDGFGYSVAITGPSNRNRRTNYKNWFRPMRMNLLDLKGMKECPLPAVIRELEVPVMTEITVAESRHVVIPHKMSGFS